MRSMTAATVLVVDDDEVNREMLSAYLESVGHRPVEAADGNAALALLSEVRPDVVLLDLKMPGKDGYAVLDEMKADDRFLDLPVIVITAVDDLRSVVRCIERGAEDYLTKPYDPTLLDARLSACLEKKRLRDQERRLHEELRVKHDALKRAEQARDALTRMIVHDMKNQLGLLVGYSGLLADTIASGEDVEQEAREVVPIIHRGARDMTDMVHEILDVAKMKSGDLKLAVAPTDLVKLARAALGSYSPAALEGTTLELRSDARELFVMADFGLITRVVQNLLSNAVKHTPAGSAVTCRIEGVEEGAIIAVQDNGPGVPAELRERIFDEYFQVEARKRGAASFGVGLGLTFCKMAVEAHGGSIRIENADSGGALFRVRLPAEPREA